MAEEEGLFVLNNAWWCFVWGRLLVEGSWAFRAKRRQIAGPHTLDPTATAREHQHNSKDQHNCGAYLRLVVHCIVHRLQCLI